MIDLRLGAWQEELADVQCDALISDPPYGARTHDGQCVDAKDGADRREISYSCFTAKDVEEFVEEWSPRTRGWMAILTCSDLANVWREAMHGAGRCTFQPVPCLVRGMTVRLSGDGPSSWAVWLMVSRPRTKKWARWGTLPGGYSGPARSGGHIGGKPAWLMSAIVRDYSRLGDVVCDPCAGFGTTLAVAESMGRVGVGTEVDGETHRLATKSLARPLQQEMFS